MITVNNEVVSPVRVFCNGDRLECVSLLFSSLSELIQLLFPGMWSIGATAFVFSLGWLTYLHGRHEPPVTSLPVQVLHHDADRGFIVVNKPGSIVRVSFPSDFFGYLHLRVLTTNA
jgi:hypothetical protein